jgi:hypothetical protein
MQSVVSDATSVVSGSTSSSTPENTATGLRALYYDVLDDLSLPRSLSLPSIQEVAAVAGETATKTLIADGETAMVDREAVRPKTRELNSDERNGAYALIGILFGSWIFAGVFAPKSAVSEEQAGDATTH